MTPEQGQHHGDQRDGRRRRTDPMRLNIWLTFAGTVLAAVIGGIFALMAAGGDKPEASATTAPPQAAATTVPVPAATATLPTAPTAAATGVPVRFRVSSSRRPGMVSATPSTWIGGRHGRSTTPGRPAT